MDLNLIETFRPWAAEGAGTGGRFPDLVRLTDQGRLAYWLLTNQQQLENEYELLLERHVSPGTRSRIPRYPRISTGPMRPKPGGSWWRMSAGKPE
jgi:hypothetical protein